MEEAMIYAVAWRLRTGNKNEFTYRLQVEKIKGIRARKKTLKALQDWHKIAEGYNQKRKEEILIFTRRFDTMKEWIKWAKTFPFKLQEVDRNNKPKLIKLGIEAKRKRTNGYNKIKN